MWLVEQNTCTITGRSYVSTIQLELATPEMITILNEAKLRFEQDPGIIIYQKEKPTKVEEALTNCDVSRF